MRFLSPEYSSSSWSKGAGLHRNSGWIKCLRPWICGGRFGISERRISVAVRTTCDLDLPVFSLVALTDEELYGFNNIAENRDLDSMHLWHLAGIRPVVRSTGISATALRIRSLCNLWADNWKRTLKHLELELEVKVGV
jgi:hypothetical protein